MIAVLYKRFCLLTYLITYIRRYFVELFPGSGRPWVWERDEVGGGEPTAARPDLCRDHHRRVRQSPAEVPRRPPDGVLVLLHHRLAWYVSDRLVREQPVPAEGSDDEVLASCRQVGQSQSCCCTAGVSWFIVLYLWPCCKCCTCISVLQGYVRGPHLQGQGLVISRPRPPKFVLEVSWSSKPVRQDSIPFTITEEYNAKQQDCSCCCKAYCPDCGITPENCVEQVSLRPRLQVKAKVRPLQGQGHQTLSSTCSRLQGQSSRIPFLLFCSATLVEEVLE